jgi:hypothetical protein
MITIATSRWSGSETCAHCFQTHSIALERRCMVCEGVVCVFCVETFGAERAIHCAACIPKRHRGPQRKTKATRVGRRR